MAIHCEIIHGTSELILNKEFPKLNRVSVYAYAMDILSKFDEELRILVSKGLKLLYVGV
ncbi:MAG: hypothetical protein WBG43_03295 [Marinifilaceae bacterium]